MKMMKVFEWPDTDIVSDAWQLYNECGSNRGYVTMWVDEQLQKGDLDWDETTEGPWLYGAIYDWLIANGAEHGETVLVNYDW